MEAAPRRIAIFRLGHIGDTIIALPALWTVRKAFPEAHLVYLSQQHGAASLAQGLEVLRPGTVFDEQLTYTLGGGGVSKWQILRTLIQLRLKRLDTLVYIPPFRTPAQLARDEKFFRLAGIKRIIGMNGYRETDYRPQGQPLPTVRHEADILLGHLARDGVQVADAPLALMDMGLSAAERAFAREWMAGQGAPQVAQQGAQQGRPVIGIGPGSKMPAKLWPVERFVEVARRLDERFSPTFVVFGGPGEREVCQQVCDAVAHGVNAAGELSIRQSAAVFEHCQLYVGNDTGTMHIAAAAKVPCVALFSARDWPGRWYPYGPQHRVHRVVVPCEGCMLEVCDKENLCLHEISVDAVTRSAFEVMESNR